MKKLKEKRKGNIPRKVEDAPKVLQIHSEKKGVKKIVKKYSSLIRCKKMPLDEALVAMGKDYSSFMHKSHAFLNINHPMRPYFEGIATKDSDFYKIFDRRYENFQRPEKIVSVFSNARYNIYGYKDFYLALESADFPTRKKILDLWYKHDGMKNIPKRYTVKGIVFDKSIDKTDTALIEKEAKRIVIQIKDIILDEYLIEYND